MGGGDWLRVWPYIGGGSDPGGVLVGLPLGGVPMGLMLGDCGVGPGCGCGGCCGCGGPCCGCSGPCCGGPCCGWGPVGLPFGGWPGGGACCGWGPVGLPLGVARGFWPGTPPGTIGTSICWVSLTVRQRERMVIRLTNSQNMLLFDLFVGGRPGVPLM